MALDTTLTFLKNLDANNSKDWMDAHRADYEREKSQFEDFVNELIEGLAKEQEAYGQLKPKDCIFRLNRDIRFSKDKSPYKTNFGAAFALGGKKSGSAGYYVHLQNGKSFVGGGHWMPDADQLKKIRQEIDYNFEDFNAIISNKKFKKYFDKIDGGKLSRPPKGYEADNPAIEYLKHKSFTVGFEVGDKDVADKHFADNVLEIFSAMRPFVDFLNQAVH